MSEREKLQRSNYQRRRKILIIVQTVIIAVVTVALAFSGYMYYTLNRDNFVSFTEEGKVIYKAYLADNEFYEEEYLNGSHAYVASLVEKMTADFNYSLKMDADVDYNYTYKVDAQVEVKDKDSQMAIYNPVFSLIEPQYKTAEGKDLTIKDSVELDYNEYNRLAKSFVAAYGLKETEANLIVRMHVGVMSESKSFVKSGENNYVIELFVPLAKDTITPHTATTVSDDQQKILAVNTNDTSLFKKLTLYLLLADAVLLIALTFFTLLTRDKHLDYSIKVKRILSAYKSYIQKVNNPVDTTAYQVLKVDTFSEMLDIRDTVQSPVLMYENDDQTCSQFFIIKGNVLYMFEVSVMPEFADLPAIRVEK